MSIKEIMEVKEAIEFVRKIKHSGNGYGNSYISDFNKLKDIILLLQQGEKCREYLKRILKRFNKIELADSGMNEETYRENMSSLLSDIACEIEQKYFPKDVSQNYEESEE